MHSTFLLEAVWLHEHMWKDVVVMVAHRNKSTKCCCTVFFVQSCSFSLCRSSSWSSWLVELALLLFVPWRTMFECDVNITSASGYSWNFLYRAISHAGQEQSSLWGPTELASLLVMAQAGVHTLVQAAPISLQEDMEERGIGRYRRRTLWAWFGFNLWPPSKWQDTN